MRLPGYCTGCRKIKQVQVSASALARGGTPTGVCAACSQPARVEHPVTDESWALMSQPCPVPEGTRIRLISMGPDPDPLPAGSEGTVTGGSGGQLWVAWDSGRSLCLVLPTDRYQVL